MKEKCRHAVRPMWVRGTSDGAADGGSSEAEDREDAEAEEEGAGTKEKKVRGLSLEVAK